MKLHNKRPVLFLWNPTICYQVPESVLLNEKNLNYEIIVLRNGEEILFKNILRPNLYLINHAFAGYMIQKLSRRELNEGTRKMREFMETFIPHISLTKAQALFRENMTAGNKQSYYYYRAEKVELLNNQKFWNFFRRSYPTLEKRPSLFYLVTQRAKNSGAQEYNFSDFHVLDEEKWNEKSISNSVKIQEKQPV